MLEYPQKYGEPREVKGGLFEKRNPLLEDVKKWGNWVLEEARKEIGRFYPSEEDGFIPMGYIWARTIKCQNPKCEAEIPLMRQFWLAKKSNKKKSLYPYVKDKKVEFEIVGTGYEKMPKDFDPSKGTTARTIAKCLVCGSMIEAKDVRKQFQEGKSGQRVFAVVFRKSRRQGKKYRIATEKDMQTYEKAEKYLEKKAKKLEKEWGISAVSDEPLKRVPVTFGVINVWVYGMNTWGSLFNSRQKLSLVTFVEKVRQAYEKMVEEVLR